VDGSRVWELETGDRVESTAAISTDGKTCIFGNFQFSSTRSNLQNSFFLA